MKKFSLFIVVLALVGWAAWYFPAPGYVLISYKTWSVEATLWFALLAFLVALFLVILLMRFLRMSFTFPSRMRLWYDGRHLRKARQDLQLGMGALIEERWREAEKRFSRHVSKSDLPVFHYIGAAKAANGLGEFERRDSYLDKARHADDDFFSFPVDILQAKLQMRAGQEDAALSTLKQLQEFVPNNPVVLRLMAEVYQHRSDWQSLQQLLPQLKSAQVLVSDQLCELTRAIYSGLLCDAVKGEGPASLDATWQSVPRDFKTDVMLLSCYIDCLIEQQAFEKAEQLLVKTLKKNWEPSLLMRYANLKTEDPDKHLKLAKSWLRSHPDDPDLLHCLGLLKLHAGQLESARAYFESSLRQRHSAGTYHALGSVLERLGDASAALAAYRKST